MARIALIFTAVLGSFSTAAELSPAQKQVRSALEAAALSYFIENANPVSGLVRDQAFSFRPTEPHELTAASIAATGMGLTVIANASARGLVSPDFARAYFNKVMRFVRDHVGRNHGWFLHWVDWRSGEVIWQDANDYSSLDTSFMIAGALYAAQIFPESEGALITDQLYRDLDFAWLMTDGGRFPERRTLSLGWDWGKGFSRWQLSIYAEQILLVVLGLGHPDHPLPMEAWRAWERRSQTAGPFTGVALNMPLFIHQYSHMYIDFSENQFRSKSMLSVSP